MAAEILSCQGYDVTVYERMKSPARKFLMAGRGGLNLTHSENFDKFIARYGPASEFLYPALHDFSPARLIEWSENLGEPTFIGSSGRIFPKSFKASPLLRSWMTKLSNAGVHFQYGQTWTGWDAAGNLIFNDKLIAADITILALGGMSWPKLGSDGSWVSILKKMDIDVHPLKPANCGFNVQWSYVFSEKFSGAPLKTISVTHDNRTIHGEIMIDRKGIEGGAIYALSKYIRENVERHGHASITIDLKPDLNEIEIARRLKARKRQSFSTFLQSSLGLSSLAVHLLREANMKASDYEPEKFAHLIKNLPLNLDACFPIEKSISSAGGIALHEIDADFMLKKIPCVFVAGEMLDWEAPTGGYLLQACFATGYRAAQGVLNYARRL